MPRGGHNAKPVALHLAQGTFRKDRHGVALALEARLQAEMRRHYTTDDPPCSFCGALGYPLFANQELTVFICPDCLYEAVKLHETASSEE